MGKSGLMILQVGELLKQHPHTALSWEYPPPAWLLASYSAAIPGPEAVCFVQLVVQLQCLVTEIHPFC